MKGSKKAGSRRLSGGREWGVKFNVKGALVGADGW